MEYVSLALIGWLAFSILWAAFLMIPFGIHYWNNSIRESHGLPIHSLNGFKDKDQEFSRNMINFTFFYFVLFHRALETYLNEKAKEEKDYQDYINIK